MKKIIKVIFTIILLLLTIRYRNSFISLITGFILLIPLIKFAMHLSQTKYDTNKSYSSQINTTLNNAELQEVSKIDTIQYEETTNSDVNCTIRFEYQDTTFENPLISESEINISDFNDIHYKALNKLKNSDINGCFDEYLAQAIDRSNFSKRCLELELIRYSTSDEDQKLLTVAECKEFLKSNSLKVSGNKSELTTRILNFNPSFYGQKHFILTDKGTALLQNYWDQRYQRSQLSSAELHMRKLQKYSISESEFKAFKSTVPFHAFDNDVIYGILNERNSLYSSKKSYSDLRENHLNMALLLESEDSRDKALDYFLKVICFDVNGYSCIGRPVLVQWLAHRIFLARPYYNSAFATVSYSQCLIEKSYFTEECFVSLINDIVYSPHFLSHSDCEDLLKKYIS